MGFFRLKRKIYVTYRYHLPFLGALVDTMAMKLVAIVSTKAMLRETNHMKFILCGDFPHYAKQRK